MTGPATNSPPASSTVHLAGRARQDMRGTGTGRPLQSNSRWPHDSVLDGEGSVSCAAASVGGPDS